MGKCIQIQNQKLKVEITNLDIDHVNMWYCVEQTYVFILYVKYKIIFYVTNYNCDWWCSKCIYYQD